MGRGVRETIAQLFRAGGGPTPVLSGDVALSSAPIADISIELLADPAVIVSADLRVVAANAAAHDLIGVRSIGSELAVAIRHPIVIDAVRAAVGGQPAIDRDISGIGRPDALYRMRIVGDVGGRLLLVFHDIGEQRRAERMRADFVANASHELRTPLATILGFVETLQGAAADDEQARRRFLAIMAAEAARMTRLIDDLLSLSRIELDKHVRPVMALALPPLFAEVGKTLAMQFESDDRLLIMDVPPDLPSVIGERDQILQVLHNLLSNALKYGRNGSPVRLTGTVTGDYFRVAVIDQGEGIAPEHLPRLTERFYRVDAGRSRSMGGTGLGLAIAKHIVERHRGQLSITSVPGEGTSVSFTLPVLA